VVNDEIFEELNAKVNPEKAFKNLRDIMMFCGRPCLPYMYAWCWTICSFFEFIIRSFFLFLCQRYHCVFSLSSGIYLTDLTFIDEGNADAVIVDGVDVPNFAKQQMVCQAIANLTQFQQNIGTQIRISIVIVVLLLLLLLLFLFLLLLLLLLLLPPSSPTSSYFLFLTRLVGEYNLSVRYPLHSFLAELPAMSENELWELSLEREPRVQQ
jgi:hypothetical protein